MAADIVAELGEHYAYFEPFCGSMAVLFGKPPSSHETVNDLHGELINLARVLASERWRELYETVDRILLCQELLDDYRAKLAEPAAPCEPGEITAESVHRAAMYMASAWIRRNGTSGTERVNYQVCARWTSAGGSPGIRWRSAVDSVPEWHDRLKGVLILHRDAFDVLAKIEDEPQAAIYVDPPYFKESRGSGGGYLHDFEAVDHVRLAKLLTRFTKARVVVSYYAHPSLALLYPGWTKRELTRTKHLAKQNKRGVETTEAPEVLLINGPSYATEEARLF